MNARSLRARYPSHHPYARLLYPKTLAQNPAQTRTSIVTARSRTRPRPQPSATPAAVARFARTSPPLAPVRDLDASAPSSVSSRARVLSRQTGHPRAAVASNAHPNRLIIAPPASARDRASPPAPTAPSTTSPARALFVPSRLVAPASRRFASSRAPFAKMIFEPPSRDARRRRSYRASRAVACATSRVARRRAS